MCTYISSKTAENTYFHISISVGAMKKLSYIIIIVYTYMTPGLIVEAANVIKLRLINQVDWLTGVVH